MIEKENQSPILAEYDREIGIYTDFSNKLEVLIQELLKQQGIRVHSITARCKDRKSLQGKIARSDGKYSSLSQVTDIVGLRIITYYNDEVDAIAKLVEQEFELDVQNSVDKRELLDPDRFGYLSLHYVVKLPEKRLALTEYARYAGCKAEIQVRSILQHTWAEIEHDMGYKSKQAIPKDIRRSFSRLAGLLEIADLEFAKIRDSLQEYENDVQEQILDEPTAVLIDQASLKSYISTSEVVQELDEQIVSYSGALLQHNDLFVGALVDKLHFCELHTISDIDNKLKEHRYLIVEFAKQVFREKWIEVMSMGLCVLYLCNILVASQDSLDLLRTYIPDEEVAREILLYYKQAVGI
ncbi:ppGpp synthetase/RelA/SpoT-type nucleotidyltransferase [Tumebacillus permanentifrigoris]|uniref:PpGpp synthetase/RelA/SpoT-type nucleotidyltransferase n=2 Tax=Tumebacillus permanentifrigoris TaxID=378543 RepID=A0A316D7S4_9BACL|nr:ppGpp synthetase/RelA/SpoT-type nucleotidyltransferase [Tumebacillus permanentifrigoris]